MQQLIQQKSKKTEVVLEQHQQENSNSTHYNTIEKLKNDNKKLKELIILIIQMMPGDFNVVQKTLEVLLEKW